jgi:CO/xanthine dehydrogenase Mo-binding subunit
MTSDIASTASELAPGLGIVGDVTVGFTRYHVPRITDTPRIDVTFCGDDDAPSTGAGEPGIVPIGAALSNAVFAATGQRHRELPIQRHLK